MPLTFSLKEIDKIPEIYSFFLIFSVSKCLRTRIKYGIFRKQAL